MWGCVESEDNLWGYGLSFDHVGPDRLRSGLWVWWKGPLLLSRRTGPTRVSMVSP